MDGCFRHEMKYEISYADCVYLRQRLRSVLAMDSNVGGDGSYCVNSIYFDNFNDKALREKRNGLAKREKLRIRYYNEDDSYIRLEKKMKFGSLCKKVSAPLTQSECAKLLGGDVSWMLRHASPLINELYCKMRHELLRPRVLVSYIREPYVYPAGNVRVTLDSDIRTSLYHVPRPETKTRGILASETPQAVILEVKYDAFLPDVIARLVQMDGVFLQSFSKYGASRRYG